MLIRKTLFTFSILFISIHSFASSQRPIGTWKAFFPYGSAFQVEESEERVYCASTLGIFFVEKEDNSLHALDKASGLSDVSIKRIKYSDAAKSLVIVYENSNIDLLVDGNTIFNIPEIKNKATTSRETIGRSSQPKHPSISDDTSEASHLIRQRWLKAVTASETPK